MQTQNISFCDKTGLNIKSNDVKQNIIDDLDEIKIIDKHHEIFDKDRHDKRLQKIPHLVSIKSNGNPYYMYFTRINFINTIVMIDKKIQMGYAYPRMIIVRMMFRDNHLFDNTLIEGEMIKNIDSKLMYLISDIHVHQNRSIKELDLFKRINILYKILDDNFVPSYDDLFQVQVKKYVPLNQSVAFHTDFIPSLNYSCRGLYFKPLYSKFKDILFNYDNSLVNRKLKPKYKAKYNFVTNDTIKNEMTSELAQGTRSPTQISIKTRIVNDIDETEQHLNTKMFQIQKTDVPDVYKLFESNGFVGHACIDSLKTSKMLNSCFHNVSMLEKIKFECNRTTNKHYITKWIPVKCLKC
jgi:hypothetical protein